MTASEARGDARVLRALASGTRASAEAHWSPRTEMFTSAIERADRFDRAALALDAYADGIDAEARGRAHGLLAAAWRLRREGERLIDASCGDADGLEDTGRATIRAAAVIEHFGCVVEASRDE